MKIEIKQNDLLLERTRMVLFLFIISVLAVALLATSTASAIGTETISIGSATVDSGDIVVLPITIADVTDVTGVDVTIVYDANIVIIQNVVANNSVVTDSSVYPNIDNTVGKATIPLTNTNFITATSAVSIIDITFEVVGNSGSSTLELQEVELSDALFNVYTPSTNNGNLVLSDTINSEVKENTIVASSVQSDSTNNKSNGYEDEDEDSVTRYASTSSQANIQDKDTNEIPSATNQPKSAIPGFGWLLTVLSLLFITKFYRNK